MRDFLKRVALGALVVAATWLLPATAHAQSLDYSALKYGTDQTSMASGYFVHPAKVTVKNHAYVVTMDIKTAKKLTSWPVKVLSVDGHAPENVRRTKDSSGNSHLSYTFSTTNLKRDVNAKLAIDVPDVYKATHKISFKFKTGNLSALRTKAAASTAKHTTTAAATSSSAKTPTANQASKKPAAATKAQSKKAKAASQSKTAASSAKRHSQSHQAKPASSTSSSNQQAATSADQVPEQKTHWGGLIGGAVAILVLVGGGSWWYFGRH